MFTAFDGGKGHHHAFTEQLDEAKRSAQNAQLPVEARLIGYEKAAQILAYVDPIAALTICEQGSDLAHNSMRSSKSLPIWNSKATAFIDLWEIDSAMAILIPLHVNAERRGSDSLLAFVCINLGQCYLAINRIDLATISFNEAITIGLRAGEPLAVYSAFNGLAAIKSRQGEHIQALWQVKASYVQFAQAQDWVGMFNCLKLTGTILKSLRSFEQADQHYREALQLANEHSATILKAQVLRLIANNYKWYAKTDSARIYMNAALEIFEGASPGYTTACKHDLV